MNIPPPASRLSPQTRDELARALIFRPEPYVRRVVFIATPHSGSPIAAGPLGRLGLLLSTRRGDAAHIGDELDAAYGPESYNGGLRGETFSIRNLNSESRVIQGLREIPLDRAVPHHSIVLQRKHPTRHGRGDGLVPYASAHLESASSELIVPGITSRSASPQSRTNSDESSASTCMGGRSEGDLAPPSLGEPDRGERAFPRSPAASDPFGPRSDQCLTSP